MRVVELAPDREQVRVRANEQIIERVVRRGRMLSHALRDRPVLDSLDMLDESNIEPFFYQVRIGNVRVSMCGPFDFASHEKESRFVSDSIPPERRDEWEERAVIVPDRAPNGDPSVHPCLR